MKLDTEQVALIARRTGATPLAEGSPSISEFSEIFGEHTYYVDAEGLNIMELGAEVANDGGVAYLNVFQVAEWVDVDKSALSPIDPRSRGIIQVD